MSGASSSTRRAPSSIAWSPADRDHSYSGSITSSAPHSRPPEVETDPELARAALHARHEVRGEVPRGTAVLRPRAHHEQPLLDLSRGHLLGDRPEVAGIATVAE